MTSPKQQPKTRNRKRQTRDEQLGNGKDSSQRQETERDKLGMNSWARAKTVAKDKKQKETNQE